MVLLCSFGPGSLGKDYGQNRRPTTPIAPLLLFSFPLDKSIMSNVGELPAYTTSCNSDISPLSKMINLRYPELDVPCPLDASF